MTFKQLALAVCAGLMLLAPASQAFADAADTELSEEHIAVIRQNCIEAQGILQRIQRTDLVTRTNRGRSYDSILKLMQALNSRVEANGINAPDLVNLRSELNRRFSDFKNNFTRYDSGIHATIRIGCESQPKVFYASLTQTRGLRNQLSGDIEAMDKYVEQYRTAVGDMQAKITNVNGGEANDGNN